MNLFSPYGFVSALSRKPILLLKLEDDDFDYFVTEPSRDKFLPYFYEKLKNQTISDLSLSEVLSFVGSRGIFRGVTGSSFVSLSVASLIMLSCSVEPFTKE